MSCLQIQSGRAYSNGVFGNQWEVREVVGGPVCNTPGDARAISYRVVVGKLRRRRFTCSHDEFLRWARYEVVRNENSWERVDARLEGAAA